MSKVTKIVLGAGAFLVMSGGLLALTGWATGADTQAMGGVHLGPGSRTEASEHAPRPPVDQGSQTGMDLEPFSKVDIDIDFGEIVILSGDAYGVSLDWSGNRYRLTYEVEGDTLTVRSTGGAGMNLAGQTASAYVYVPQDAALEEVDAHTSLGDIDFSGVTAQEVELSGDLGNISGYEFTVEELSVKCSLGDISLWEGSAGTAKLTNSMGDVDTGGFTTASSLTVEADLGSVDLQGDFQGETDVEASMGSVTLTLVQPESAYSYDLEADAGELRVNGEVLRRGAGESGGPNILSVETSMGDIDLWFGDG